LLNIIGEDDRRPNRRPFGRALNKGMSGFAMKVLGREGAKHLSYEDIQPNSISG
jgi:hypothetical protein